MGSLFNLLDSNSNKFYFNENTKKKLIIYNVYKKHKDLYTSHIEKKEFNIGEQLCDFLNTDFENIDGFKNFNKKYGINYILNLTNIKFSDYPISAEEYENSIEIKDLTSRQRFQVMANSDKQSESLMYWNDDNVNLNLSAFEILRDYSSFPMRQEETQRIVAKANIPSSYFIECSDIIQTLLIEFIEIANLNIEIKKCRNCGKFLVPDNRSDEIYCSNIFENGKTCKEIGHFKVQQKLIHENDNLRIYRNVYQKLLLRTRRNPDNIQYARDFEFF